MRRLILRTFQSPGDVLMLTAAVRDLHAAHPGQFQTDVRTSADAIWLHNPHLTPLAEGAAGVETIDMHYPLVHQSNQRPYHFIHGYAQYLEERLGVRIPLTRFAGEVFLSPEEKEMPVLGAEDESRPAGSTYFENSRPAGGSYFENSRPAGGSYLGVPERFWIIVAGGKFDFTAKWWNPDSYQEVVDYFWEEGESGRQGERERASRRKPDVPAAMATALAAREAFHLAERDDYTCAMRGETDPGQEGSIRGSCVTSSAIAPEIELPFHLAERDDYINAERDDYISFVQCGEAGHWHLPLRNAVNLVGKTSLREFIRLVYHAEGVVCPVTFAMHLAAAVETKPGRPKSRPCVVVAGGREPTHWEAYPTHQYISTVGMLPCCETGGCWKSRCQTVGDGDAKDRRDLCERPVQVSPELRIPECMSMITPHDVIRRIQMYRRNGPPSAGRVAENRPAASAEPLTQKTPAADACRLAEERDRNQTTPAASAVPLTGEREPPMKSMFIEFRHGLGDAVQLTVVLKHLRKLRPDWNVDVAAQRGKNSAFGDLCREVYALECLAERHGGRFLQSDRSSYAQVHKIEFHESREDSARWPNTKATRCLKEVFGITPEPELCRYEIQVGAAARERARAYLAQVSPAPASTEGRFPAVLIHYEGNTSGQRKNLSHDLARELCDTALRLGYAPIILDWDKRSPLPDGVRVHNPGADHPLWRGLGTGDAETLAALIEASALLIGIDSGPLHVAGATSTPTIGVWTHHHPVHFFDLCPNVLHLVPGDHEKLAAGPAALEAFRKLYRYHTYKQPYVDLPAMVESLLTGASFEELSNKRFLKELTATGYTERYYEEHKLAGLDYLNFGEWHEEYGRWFVDSLCLRGKRLLDVGCACGAILRGLGQAGAVVQGVELNEHMVQLGRAKWPDMARLLHVCDAVNLHLFTDESWDAIHSAQVAEHWRPELVPFILRELHRVVTPGGLFFAALDTEELFARQGRTIETEDPTHVCIRPLAWWHDELSAAGWQVCSADFEPPMRSHPESFLARYDWDWFVARKKGMAQPT